VRDREQRAGDVPDEAAQVIGEGETLLDLREAIGRIGLEGHEQQARVRCPVGTVTVEVAPYLIAEVMASNIGGTATLVGDPPNIIIASRAGLSFNDFLVNLAPMVVVLIIVYCLLCRWLLAPPRRALRAFGGRASGSGPAGCCHARYHRPGSV
jgi:di/tricarboxylate transporter